MYTSYKIDKISVKSFRGISYETSLKLKEITILCGENGTGKSSFVNAFEYAFSKKIDHLSRKTIDKEKSTVHRGNDKKDMAINVSFKNNKSLTLKPTKDDELKEILSHEYIKNASFILNRRNLLKFIDGTQTKRYEAIMNLCGFKKLIKYQSLLSKSYSDIDKELNNKIKEYDEKIVALSNILVADDSLDYDESINELNILLKKNNLQKVNKTTIISDYLLDFQVERTNILKEVLKDFNVYYDNLNLEKLDESLSQLLKRYEEVVYENFKYANDLIPILENSKDLIKDNNLNNCPICGSDIDSEVLVPRINSYVTDLTEKNQDFNLWKKELYSFIEDLKRLINILDNLDAMVLSINQFINETINPDDLYDDYDKIKETILLYLKNFSFNKEKLQLEELCSDLSDLSVTGEMIDFDKFLFKNIGEKVDILKDNLYDYYELTSDNTELLIIYDALLNLDKLNELNSQINELKQKYNIANICLETFKESKEKFINNIIFEIKEDIKHFYEFIHGDDEISAPDIQLTDTNFVDVYLKSFGEDVDPRSYASEGHLDSLGLCIFLAFNKKFNQIPFIILDDVISTVDLSHKERIGRLLVEELSDYQLLITTHNSFWATQLKRIANVSNRGSVIYEILSWSLEDGPILSIPMNSEEKIEKYLNPEDYDLHAAGNTARRYLEYILKEICKVNTVDVPIQEHLDLNSYFQNAKNKTLKVVKKTSVENYYKEVWDELEKTRFIANVLSHDNEEFAFVSYNDTKTFCDGVLKLKKAFTCEEDGSFVKLDNKSKKIICSNPYCKMSIDMNAF